MASVDEGQTPDTESGDLGDVLAVVEKPQGFDVPERTSWKYEGAVTAAAMFAGRVSGTAGLVAVPLAILGVVAANRQVAPSRPPDVALLALPDAKKLVQRELLFFPDGGPTVSQVYARHPLRARDYLPYASYHRLVLHEKSFEIARYLLALGARDVEITCDQSTGKEGTAQAGIAAPNVNDLAMGMGFKRDNTGKLAIRVTGAGKRRKVPHDLIWPGQDPIFKLAHDAAQAGSGTFHFGLRTEQSGSVNARAAAKLHKELGLDLGGEYKRWEDLSFSVDATFGPRPS